MLLFLHGVSHERGAQVSNDEFERAIHSHFPHRHTGFLPDQVYTVNYSRKLSRQQVQVWRSMHYENPKESEKLKPGSSSSTTTTTTMTTTTETSLWELALQILTDPLSLLRGIAIYGPSVGLEFFSDREFRLQVQLIVADTIAKIARDMKARKHKKHEECKDDDAELPLILLGHSLGSVVLLEFVHDALTGVLPNMVKHKLGVEGLQLLTSGERDPNSAHTNAKVNARNVSIISCGCPFVWFFPCRTTRVNWDVFAHYNIKWINFYFPGDALAGPVQPLGYPAEDRCMDGNQLFLGNTFVSHALYASLPDVFNTMSDIYLEFKHAQRQEKPTEEEFSNDNHGFGKHAPNTYTKGSSTTRSLKHQQHRVSHCDLRMEEISRSHPPLGSIVQSSWTLSPSEDTSLVPNNSTSSSVESNTILKPIRRKQLSCSATDLHNAPYQSSSKQQQAKEQKYPYCGDPQKTLQNETVFCSMSANSLSPDTSEKKENLVVLYLHGIVDVAHARDEVEAVKTHLKSMVEQNQHLGEVEFVAPIYADLLEESQNAVWEHEYSQISSLGKWLRNVIVKRFPVSMGFMTERRYREDAHILIHLALIEARKRLVNRLGGGLDEEEISSLSSPSLVVIGYSMGSIVSMSMLKNGIAPRNDFGFGAHWKATRLLTLGCPASWFFDPEDLELPSKKASEDSSEHPQRPKFSWWNMFDAGDPCSGPLKSLSWRYQQAIDRDIGPIWHWFGIPNPCAAFDGSMVRSSTTWEIINRFINITTLVNTHAETSFEESIHSASLHELGISEGLMGL